MSVEATSSSPNPPGQEPPSHELQWHGSGRAMLEAALAGVESALTSVRLEMYIFAESPIGHRFREALIAAAGRGVKVSLLLDALGSRPLAREYFAGLEAEPTASVKWFNRPSLATWSFRDHRKLVIIDESHAFVGGCNIGTEYHGDGVAEGWRDGGISVRGPVLESLVREFDAQWRLAEEKQWRHRGAHRARRHRATGEADVEALFVFPGFGHNPLRDAIRGDLKVARRIGITSPYFLPSLALRRQIASPERRGAEVRLLLAGRTDVPLMQLASRSLYRSLLSRGVEIYEYLPQILHAKVLVLDDIVYVGSSNLDPRSLRINFEIMLRLRDPALAAQAWRQFETDLSHSHQWTLDDVRGHRTWWRRIKQKVAYFILARLDPRVAEGNLRRWLSRQKASVPS